MASAVCFALLLAAQPHPDTTQFSYPADAPVEVIEAQEDSADGYVRVEVEYPSPVGGMVPAYLYLPEGSGPAPALVLTHGMPGHRGTLEPLSVAYARAGAVVLSISLPFARPAPLYRDPGLFILPLFDERDADEIVQGVIDLRRGVDLLRQHPRVDSGRIGFVGFSYGGLIGGILAGVEHRIRAYALASGIPSLPARFLEDAALDLGALVDRTPEQLREWDEVMARVDSRRFLPRARAGSLLFQFGEADDVVTRAQSEAFVRAAGRPVASFRYRAGHDLLPRAWTDQAEWFGSRFGWDVSGFVAPSLEGAEPARGGELIR